MEESTCGCLKSPAIKIIGIIVLGVVMLGAIFQQVFLPSTNTVTVIGQGRVPVKPDIAVLDLSIMTLKAANTNDALEQTTEKVQKVQAALNTFGIPEEDRQVTGYAFNPAYDVPQSTDANGDSQPSDKIVGYNGLQQITVKVRGIDQDKQKIDKIIESVINAGASQVGTAKFIYSDIEKAKQQARLAAIADAKSKADTMVKTAGVKLKNITGWSENIIMAPWQDYQEGNYSYNNTSSVSFNNENNPVSTSVNDQTEVVMEVSMSYNIK